jgi:hypothetical protein
MRAVSAVLPYAAESDELRKWVITSLYPAFVKHIESGNEKVRVWAIKRLGIVAWLDKEQSRKSEVRDSFLRIWFSDETSPDSVVGKELQQQLLVLASENLLRDVRIKAKDANTKVKAKAEMLLETFKGYLTH